MLYCMCVVQQRWIASCNCCVALCVLQQCSLCIYAASCTLSNTSKVFSNVAALAEKKLHSTVYIAVLRLQLLSSTIDVGLHSIQIAVCMY
jgi:hypothetical protein